MAVLADDDVVVDLDAERFCHLDDAPGHVDVGTRGRGIARRVVVAQNSQRKNSLFISTLCESSNGLGYGFGVWNK